MKNLLEIYHDHRGKVSDKWSSYLLEYERIFSCLRDRPIRILEIGIQNGGSLEIWCEYFQNAQLVMGVDVNTDCQELVYDDERVKVVVGDANSDAIESEILSISNQFDLIIDDGSHVSGDIVKSFARYFRHLTFNGVYVVEDLHCSYWDTHVGGLFYPYSSISFFKRLADVLNYQHWGVEKNRNNILKGFSEHYNAVFEESDLAEIHSIEFLNSACMIRKARAESNLLGDRIIVGNESVIYTLSREQDFKHNQVENPWSILSRPPEEDWVSLSSAVAKNDKDINELALVLREKEKQKEELTRMYMEGDNQKEKLTRMLRERDEQLVELKRLISEKDLKLIDSHYLTKWLDKRFMRRIKQLFELLDQSIKIDGNIKSLAIKAIRVYRAEGLSGFKWRIKMRWKMSQAVFVEKKVQSSIKLNRHSPIFVLHPDLDDSIINYYGYIRAESGLGSACRGNIDALRLLDKTVHPINLPCGLRETNYPVSDDADTSAMFSIIHMNADSINYFRGSVDVDCLAKSYKIGYWVWELAAFRPDWFDSFEFFNEIWVPSTFCRDSIAAISPIPVHVIPHVVSEPIKDIDNAREYFDLPKNSFVYGFMFDCSSLIERKNPLALIEAFKRFYKQEESALLFLKVSNGAKDPKLYKTLIQSIKDCENIITIEHSLTDAELGAFFSAIDCYVSPHRSEGFGLTIAEAMFAGKPVIATNYGGSTDFVKSEHAYLLKYSLATIKRQQGPYLRDYVWAEPDIDHLVELMGEVYSNSAIAKLRGELAHDYIQRNFSINVVSELIGERLSEIRNKGHE